MNKAIEELQNSSARIKYDIASAEKKVADAEKALAREKEILSSRIASHVEIDEALRLLGAVYVKDVQTDEILL